MEILLLLIGAVLMMIAPWAIGYGGVVLIGRYGPEKYNIFFQVVFVLIVIALYLVIVL